MDSSTAFEANTTTSAAKVDNGVGAIFNEDDDSLWLNPLDGDVEENPQEKGNLQEDSTEVATRALEPLLTQQQSVSSDAEPIHWRTSYNWRKDGSAKHIKSRDVMREWFHCSGAKTSGCTARYYIDKDADGVEAPPASEKMEHNHPPPNKLHLTAEVKQQVVARLNHQQKVGNIHKDITLSTPNPTSATVPTRKQISNIKAYLRQTKFPTADAISNIIEQYGGKFLVYLELYPYINVVLVAPSAKTHFAVHGKFLLLDGTFNLVEEGLTLVTFMLLVQNIGFPAAFVLTNSETTDNFFHICQLVKEATKPSQFSPGYIMADYDAGMRKGLEAAFPGSLVLGDAFHFIQANLKWVRKHTGKDVIDIKELVINLRVLWASPDVPAFTHNHKQFSEFYLALCPLYIQYFNKYWISQIGFMTWAYCGRGDDVPTGDQALESYHNRLETLIRSEKKNEALDYFVATLFDEYQYQEKVIATPVLLQARIQEHAASSNKYKRQRQTLGNYVHAQQSNLKKLPQANLTEIPTQISSHQPVPSISSHQPVPSISSPLPLPSSPLPSPSSPLPSSPSINSLPSLTAAEISSSTIETSSSITPSSSPFAFLSSSSSLGKSPHIPSLNSPSPFRPPTLNTSPNNVTMPLLQSVTQLGLCVCGKKSSNKVCSLKLCQHCCAVNPNPCIVATHNSAKAEASMFYPKIRDGIQDRKRILMGYMGGSNPGTKRVVQLLRWTKDKKAAIKFTAYCETGEMEKDYFVTLVSSVEDAPPDSMVVSSQ